VTKSCLHCRHLKYQKGRCWCVKGHLKSKSETLPIKPSERFRAAKTCKDYEGMDE
jgi:hypothetical protein